MVDDAGGTFVGLKNVVIHANEEPLSTSADVSPDLAPPPPVAQGFQPSGAIGTKWNELGGSGSWLGAPTSDELPFGIDGGKYEKFQNGAIYWWGDVGAVAIRELAVDYKGLYAFGITDGAGSDEPYMLITVITPDGSQPVMLSQLYSDVDSGEPRADDVPIYRGGVQPLSLLIVAMEHDFGNPDEFKGLVDTAVDMAKQAAAAGGAYLGGPAGGEVARRVAEEAGPYLAKAISGALDTQDDRIDMKTLHLSAKDLVRSTQMPLQDFFGIQWRIESPLLAGDGASYKAYFDVQSV